MIKKANLLVSIFLSSCLLLNGAPAHSNALFKGALEELLEQLGAAAVRYMLNDISQSTGREITREDFTGVELTLKSASGGEIDIYSQPSTQSFSPHYGLPGDKVISLAQTQRSNGSFWYYIAFPSGAKGWIRNDFATVNPAPAKSSSRMQFPIQGRLIGLSAGSQVSVYESYSVNSKSPHYGLVGDRVTVIQETKNNEGRIWYFIRFQSGADGWVPKSFVQI